MQRQFLRFRRQVEAHFCGRPGRGARYPVALQTQAVEIALATLAEGGRIGPVAKELGVGVGTLRRWTEAAPRRAQPLRVVEVVEASPAPSAEGNLEGSLVLVTVGGHRVEGLALAEVALLLETLG